MKKIGLRIDIDSIGDVKTIPIILEMLEKHEIMATFFITTGPDRTCMNLKKYLIKPYELLKAKPGRYGLTTLTKGFIKPEFIQDYNKELNDILNLGHEIGLHGHDHYRWINSQMDQIEIVEAMTKGIFDFKSVFGQMPTSFASPGFRSENKYLKIVDRFNFRYSSDFVSNMPFYPSINGGVAKTLQIPVVMRSPLELALEGMSDDVILHHFKEQITEKEFFTFYIHPSYECFYKKELISKMISYCSEIRDNLTFQRIYEDLENENTSDL